MSYEEDRFFGDGFESLAKKDRKTSTRKRTVCLWINGSPSTRWIRIFGSREAWLLDVVDSIKTLTEVLELNTRFFQSYNNKIQLFVTSKASLLHLGIVDFSKVLTKGLGFSRIYRQSDNKKTQLFCDAKYQSFSFLYLKPGIVDVLTKSMGYKQNEEVSPRRGFGIIWWGVNSHSVMVIPFMSILYLSAVHHSKID
ncbi:hypothetical protein HNY73_012872 [Argiope bruennichi]|uniref:Uncharacterized protein n=1 Tax=Argiope bruennichi TaxID=94029 RepID=A0A8T0F125_ARGBR|nr:hypothetical protein HNY73_012872 [Argiope bruennichi]